MKVHLPSINSVVFAVSFREGKHTIYYKQCNHHSEFEQIRHQNMNRFVFFSPTNPLQWVEEPPLMSLIFTTYCEPLLKATG